MNTTTNTAQRYFIYARKSKKDDKPQVKSIKDQIAELNELAQRDGLVVIDTLTENKTAKTPGRPVFNEMLKRIQKGEGNVYVSSHCLFARRTRLVRTVHPVR